MPDTDDLALWYALTLSGGDRPAVDKARKSGSQLTHRWSERDSNSRSPREEPLDSRGGKRGRRSIKMVSRDAVPFRGRIRFPTPVNQFPESQPALRRPQAATPKTKYRSPCRRGNVVVPYVVAWQRRHLAQELSDGPAMRQIVTPQRPPHFARGPKVLAFWSCFLKRKKADAGSR
jgi:hypothetical protein